MSNVVAMPVQNESLVAEDCVRVVSLRACQKSGLVAAHVDVQFGPWLVKGSQVGPFFVYGISIVREKNGKGYWVGLPSSLAGSGKRYPVFEIEKGGFRERVCKVILDFFSSQSPDPSGAI